MLFLNLETGYMDAETDGFKVLKNSTTCTLMICTHLYIFFIICNTYYISLITFKTTYTLLIIFFPSFNLKKRKKSKFPAVS